MLGVSVSVYSRWENNKYIIPTRRLYQLANYYKINIDYLLGFTDKEITIDLPKEIDKKICSARATQIRKDYNESIKIFV